MGGGTGKWGGGGGMGRGKRDLPLPGENIPTERVKAVCRSHLYSVVYPYTTSFLGEPRFEPHG
jgi:hypothetical protein